MTGDILKRRCVGEVRIKGKQIEGEVWREGRGGVEGRKGWSGRKEENEWEKTSWRGGLEWDEGRR